MPNNGLKHFSIHQNDSNVDHLQGISRSVAPESFNVENKKVLKPEMVALQYLEHSLEDGSEVLQSFTAPKVSGGDDVKYEPMTTEYLPLTGNKIVKFRQRVNGISVYGSAVNIELDNENNFVSINSSLALALQLSGTAMVSPEQARRIAAEYLGTDVPDSITPLLFYYFYNEKWKLVYILKSIPLHLETSNYKNLSLMNIIVDASEGNVIEVTPATITFRIQESALDENAATQSFFISQDNNRKIMVDDDLQVYTYDNSFKTYFDSSIPGEIISKSNNGWVSAGVSAHVNAGSVALFLRNVLKRNSVNGAGMKILSSINCTERAGNQQWFNAAWLPNRNQMVYGQVKINGKFKSLCSSLDVVGHEIFHGVTQYTANLEYHNQSGTLNESYSDIFGVLISNYKNTDVNSWNWDLGEDISGTPLRNLKQPALFDQPEHMNDYRNLPDNENGDWGGVHINSGIHNKTAYLMLTATIPSGNVFTPDQVAQLYYLALVQLGEKSEFADSYRSIKNAAKSLFHNDPAIDLKLKTIDDVFHNVGIN